MYNTLSLICFTFTFRFVTYSNKYDLGKTQDQYKLSDVIMPDWVKSGLPEEFVFMMRERLESKEVSEALHSWIDLIFGCYQKSEEKMNLFQKYTYEGTNIYNSDDDNQNSIHQKIKFIFFIKSN